MKDKVLVIAEHNNQHPAVDTLRTLQAAQSLPGDIDVMVIGYGCGTVAEALRAGQEIETVWLADDAVYEHHLAENMAELIAETAKDYSHILAPATTFGKNLLPRVAALLDVGQLSDVVAIESADTVVRPIYAGNALARVQSLDPIKVMTIRSSTFDPVSLLGGDAEVIKLEKMVINAQVQFVSRQQVESARPQLGAARVVVAGGRGLGSKAQFNLIEQLADKLGGAIGASRAAVDAGFVSNDLQVGQTGKIVAPDLYIAVGISGAIQHLAGMKDSKVIVAINSDPDAPIFQLADYGLVGDLFEIMPELIDTL